MHFPRISIRALFAASTMMLALTPFAKATDIRQPDAVVELFTSQGCSSCPPADRVLTKLVEEGRTLALAWHVDYWDYLGWKDTFGSKAATKRQKAYAAALGKRGVYTPQAVINGQRDIVGSRGLEVMQAIREMKGTSQGLTVPINASIEGNVLNISVNAGGDAEHTTLWMVYFDNGADVVVERGENKGHTLRYSNIVRDAEMIGMVDGKDLSARFEMGEMGRRGYDSCALILQKSSPGGVPGPIVGAAIIKDISR